MKLQSSLAVLIALAGFLTGCSTTRQSVPVGVVPQLHDVGATDEQYGHQVLNELTTTYPLSRNDDMINRVRDIVDHLTSGRDDLSRATWHVYVLEGNDVKNAAATRGNYIFVWTGMANAVSDDDQLAAVLAHEIGHLLAGHPVANPAEEANEMISGIAGVATRSLVASQVGALAGIAETLVRETFKAAIVNPESQRKELEADQIGLFLMADAGIDPEKALRFWKQASDDPAFKSNFPEVFSSHPASNRRLATLAKLVPQAEERYNASRRRGKSRANRP